MVGQVLPFLSAKLSLTDSESSWFFVSHFTGSISGIILYEFLVKRKGFLRVIRTGSFCAAAGMLLLNSETKLVCSLGFFLNGIGTGANIPAANMFMAKISPSNLTSSLSFLNFFWGLGAIVSQPFVFALADENDIFVPTLLLSTCYLLTLSFLNNLPDEKQENDATNRSFLDIWRNPVAWLIAVFNFAHVGLESGIGGWLTTYSERFYDQGISATPVFFTFFVAGRLIAPIVMRILSENVFIFLCLLVLTGGLFLILLSENLLLVGASVCGIGTSAIFPTNMARFTKIFTISATKNASPLFVMGSLGGVVTTSLIGFVSESFGSLQYGITVLIFNSLILLVIQALIFFGVRSTR